MEKKLKVNDDIESQQLFVWKKIRKLGFCFFLLFSTSYAVNMWKFKNKCVEIILQTRGNRQSDNHLPSEYADGNNFRKGAPRAPQTGCRTLLQAPEGVLYLLGGQGLSGLILQGASFDPGLNTQKNLLLNHLSPVVLLIFRANAL